MSLVSVKGWELDTLSNFKLTPMECVFPLVAIGNPYICPMDLINILFAWGVLACSEKSQVGRDLF